MVKNLLAMQETICNARRLRFDPWVRKIPWRREWQPLQYSCLENPMDRGDWGATVHGIAKSQTRLSNFHSLKLTQAQPDLSLC